MKIAFTLLLVLTGAFTAAQAQEVKGDAKAGEKKNAMCIGCHAIPGYHASFPQIYKVPMISGQNAKYIVAALDAYRKGDRKHPTMKAVAGSLTDQDIADLAAYYSTQGVGSNPTPVPATAELPAALKEKMVACVACHGTNFNNTIDPGNPRLAGQYADYLYEALKSYKTEGLPLVGRNNATMVGMAKPLSDAEIRQIASYLASLPGEMKTVPQSRFR
ncbi:MAG TPA: c-type cytochrome [Ideonella sp.]|nr:c-type cytochrome [Ideonella sp.]